MSRQREALFPQMLRATVVDQAEIGAGEFRIGGHLDCQTRFRRLAGQIAARHQTLDLHVPGCPDRNRIRISDFPADLKEQRHLHQDQFVLADGVPAHEFLQTPRHSRMHKRIQRRERFLAVFRREKPP